MTNTTRFRACLKGHFTSPTDAEKQLLRRLDELHQDASERSWSHYRNFWPPAVIRALRTGDLILFMGAGVSAGSNLPAWTELLEKRLGIPAEFVADDYLKNDNLTLGEIAARRLGREQLQTSLRGIYNSPGAEPTLVHYALAALELSTYVTTNYDGLFEKAWERLHGRPLTVISTATDALLHAGNDNKLYKIHGSAERVDELLVLTRSDYRRHYRANEQLFDELKNLMATKSTLFTGFSHTDPEVARLIDDIIYTYERELEHAADGSKAPEFYNMQFEDSFVANQRLAAKGLVSLNVRLAEGLQEDVRTIGVAESIADLVDAATTGMDEETALDDELDSLVDYIRRDLMGAIDELRPAAQLMSRGARGSSLDPDIVAEALAGIDLNRALGAQGVYVVDTHGSLIQKDGELVGVLYQGLDRAARTRKIRELSASFAERPYFQTSKSYRWPFVSDLFESVFNRHSSFAICHPILANQQFAGLLFSVCQIGQWKAPIEAAKPLNEDLFVYLIDGQGIAAMPPRNEFPVRPSDAMPSEPDERKLGYPHAELRLLSRKDKIVRRLARNIVPVDKDDDVVSLDRELDVYARIKNLPDSSWRCALARRIEFTKDPSGLER